MRERREKIKRDSNEVEINDNFPIVPYIRFISIKGQQKIAKIQKE